MSCCLVVSTVSTIDEAKTIARGLVQSKLAACTNIIPGIISVYFWKNEICEDNEYILLIKTRRQLFDKVRDYIVANHSYELPEVIMLPIEEGLEGYLNWIRENTDEKSNNSCN